MRVLLLHPEDSPRRGPWSRQRWDLIVDLGRSSPFSEQQWSKQYGCPVLRAEVFRRGVADAKLVRESFAIARGHLMDEEGIDWWEVATLQIVPQALDVLVLRRVAAEIGAAGEMWATRAGWRASLIAAICRRRVLSFGGGWLARSAAGVAHYAGLVRRFPAGQIREIFLDKYDAGYRWRSRFAAEARRRDEPVVLLPSAYGNVSRMAADYARMMPQQAFLLVATRRSAKQFTQPANVEVRDLGAYAAAGAPGAEASSLLARWTKLRAEMDSSVDLRMLLQVGVLDDFPAWVRDGLCARNAWRAVMEREPVSGVLCGDDSNLYTRLPVLLAPRRKIATVDFHHGAFDGRYLLKDLGCELYLAKNEMELDYLVRVCGLAAEKIVIAAPERGYDRAAKQSAPPEGAPAVYFSEPYEAAGIRTEEVYRELLPPLVRVVRENGCGLIVKLHPFESRAQRTRMVREVLAPEDAARVTLLDGPLTSDLISRTWFGITVESSTALDCQENGVRCFLCGWLATSPYEYMRQYARFGVGEMLEGAEHIGEIPTRLANLENQPSSGVRPQTADPESLQRWLTSSAQERCGARSAS
jgi:hypothetical protein